MSDRRRSPDRRRRRSSSPRRASPRRRRYISPRGSPSREYSEDHYYRFTSHESREYRRSPERRRRFTGGRDQSANREPERSYRRERYNRSISREPCSSPGSGRSYSRREPDRSYSRERGSPQRRRSSSRHKHMSSSRESDRCYSRESSSYSSNRNRSVAREPYSSPEKRTFSSSGRGRSPSRSSICSDHSSPIYKASSSENYDSSLSSEKRKSSRGRYIISGQENPRRSRSPEKSSSSRPTTSVHKSHKSQEQDRHIQSPKIKYPSGELDRTSSSRERWHREDNMLSREDPFPRRIPRSSQEPLPFQTNRIRQQRPYSHGKNRYIGKVTQDRRSKQDVKICNDCNFQTTSQDELIQHTRMKIRYGSCPKQDPVANPSRTEEALGLLKKRHLLVVDKEWLMESIGGWEIRSLMPHEDEEAEEQK